MPHHSRACPPLGRAEGRCNLTYSSACHCYTIRRSGLTVKPVALCPLPCPPSTRPHAKVPTSGIYRSFWICPTWFAWRVLGGNERWNGAKNTSLEYSKNEINKVSFEQIITVWLAKIVIQLIHWKGERGLQGYWINREKQNCCFNLSSLNWTQ